MSLAVSLVIGRCVAEAEVINNTDIFLGYLQIILRISLMDGENIAEEGIHNTEVFLGIYSAAFDTFDHSRILYKQDNQSL